MHIEEMAQKMAKKENSNPYENQIKLFDKKIIEMVGFIEEKFNNDMTNIASDVLKKNLKSVKIELN